MVKYHQLMIHNSLCLQRSLNHTGCWNASYNINNSYIGVNLACSCSKIVMGGDNENWYKKWTAVGEREDGPYPDHAHPIFPWNCFHHVSYYLRTWHRRGYTPQDQPLPSKHCASDCKKCERPSYLSYSSMWTSTCLHSPHSFLWQSFIFH